jgi:hypothetical protein
MNRTRSEIECLNRLQALTGQLFDIILFLKDEKLIDDNHIRTVKGSSDTSKEIQLLLKSLQKEGKFQLLEYTWNILPVETINIYIITDRNQKEFVYNG